MSWSLVAAGGRRAIFALGDSECDTGNNNYLATKYRADFPPYGIDFYPTGRFSNGRILVDSISEGIGLGYILPYLSPQLNGEWLLKGASFASAGIGILNATGVQFGKRRDICDDELQTVVASYNARLAQLTTQINSDLDSQVFVFIDAFRLGNDVVNNPKAYGFVVSRVACCGQGAYNGEGPCTVASNLCPDRDVYVFWDSIHPTQRVVELLAYQIFYGSADFISPMNLSTIMAVDHWGY
ncbi:GDSL esterase/lipase At4g28780 [Linum grandiflorum]